MLMQIAGYEYGGQYKTGDDCIIEEDKDGNRKIRFKPTPASEVKESMEQLELAYMEARNNANINQLLLIPCVILDFLCIHPFRDGNGGMSRLLSLLLLYKNDYYPIDHIEGKRFDILEPTELSLSSVKEDFNQNVKPEKR
jgi:Fic family protein